MNTYKKEKRRDKPIAALVGFDEDKKQCVHIYQDVTTIGRSENATICIKDPLISRKHCIIERAGDSSFTICDVSSAKTTTRVNGALVTKNEPFPLHHHANIELADSEKYSYRFLINKKLTSSSQTSILSPEMKTQIRNLDNSHNEEMTKLNVDLLKIEAEKEEVEKLMRAKMKEQENQFREEKLSLMNCMISATRDKEELEKQLKVVEEKNTAEKERLHRENEIRISDMLEREKDLQELKNEMELRHINEHKELQDRFKAETDELKKKLAEYEEKCKQQEDQNRQTRDLQLRLEEQEKQIVELEETKKKMIELEIEQFRVFEEKTQVQEDLGSKIIDLTNESTNKDEYIKMLEKQLQENAQKENNQKRVFEGLEEELQCSICTELFIEPTTLNCGHMFCKTCIEEWKRKKKECPVCRAKIVTSLRSYTVDCLIDKNVALLSEEAKARREMLLKSRQEGQHAVPSKKRKQKHRAVALPTATPPHVNLPISPIVLIDSPTFHQGIRIPLRGVNSGQPNVLNDSIIPMNLNQGDPFSWSVQTRTRNRSNQPLSAWLRPAEGPVTVAAIDLTSFPQPDIARPSTSTGVTGTVDLTNL